MEWEQTTQRTVRGEEACAEARRLASLHSLGLLNSGANTALDGIVKAAAGLFDAPIALVSLLDGKRQWFKAKFDPDLLLGDATEVTRNGSFCNLTIQSQRAMLVTDAHLEPLFQSNPLVKHGPHLRFYAGAPLISSDGSIIGTLCVMDVRAGRGSAESQKALARLATVVMDLLLAESEGRNLPAVTGITVAANAEAKILQQAVNLLAEHGASGFSVRKVARASGISLGHLQHYFKDKKTLQLAVLDSIAKDFESCLENNFEVFANPNDRILQYGSFVLDQASEMCMFLVLREHWAMSARDEDIAKKLKSIHERLFEFMSKAIIEANPELSRPMAESRAAVSLALLSGAFLFQGQGAERDSNIRQAVLESIVVLPSGQRAPSGEAANDFLEGLR